MIRTERDIEEVSAEPLRIIRGQEFFPFRDVSRIDFPDFGPRYKSRGVILDENDQMIDGRLLLEEPFDHGNVDIRNVPFLPYRIYTLADLEDDLVEYSDSYPGWPTTRAQFSVVFDLPKPIEQESEFRKSTRIKVVNHLTGKAFYAVEKRSSVGYYDTECPRQDRYGLIYGRFFYDGMRPDDRIDKPTSLINLGISSRGRSREEIIEDMIRKMKKVRESPEAFLERTRKEEIADQMVTYWHLFFLAFLNNPRVMDEIGITIETVPVKTIDLSVNSPDQLLH